MIKQIGTVAVYVEDQQKAKQFWSEKVGFALWRTIRWGQTQAGWRSHLRGHRLV